MNVWAPLPSVGALLSPGTVRYVGALFTAVEPTYAMPAGSESMSFAAGVRPCGIFIVTV